MITKKELLRSGYKEFEKNKFQKCIRDSLGKRYFINIEYYNLEMKQIPKSLRKGFECNFQFQNAQVWKNYICPNFKIDVTRMESVFIMESYISKLWIVSGCPYYEEGC